VDAVLLREAPAEKAIDARGDESMFIAPSLVPNDFGDALRAEFPRVGPAPRGLAA
jgi:hypothetical protein